MAITKKGKRANETIVRKLTKGILEFDWMIRRQSRLPARLIDSFQNKHKCVRQYADLQWTACIGTQNDNEDYAALCVTTGNEYTSVYRFTAGTMRQYAERLVTTMRQHAERAICGSMRICG